MSQTFPAQQEAPREVPLWPVEGAQPSRLSLLRRKALAAELDCSLRTIDNLQSEGMPCVFIGRSRRYILSEVIAWLKRKGGRA